MNKQKWTKASVPGALFRLASIGMAAVLLITALISAQPAQLAAAAVTGVTCTTTASGVWTASIWSCPGGPTSADDVVILHEVSLVNNQSIKSLSVSADQAGSKLGVLRFDKAAILTLSGDLNVDAKGILDPGNGSSGGTIVFGAGSQMIKTNGEVVDFWNLSKISAAAETLTFDTGAGSVHVLNQLTLSDKADAKLQLRGVNSGAWRIAPDSGVNVQWVDVKGSNNASSINNEIKAAQSTDSGENKGWNFNGSAVIVTVSPNPAGYKKPVTITAFVVPADATGDVEFFYGDKVIDECEDVPLVNGQASCTTKKLPLGKQTISAVFTPAEGSSLPLNVATPVDQMIGFANIYIPMINQQ